MTQIIASGERLFWPQFQIKNKDAVKEARLNHLALLMITLQATPQDMAEHDALANELYQDDLLADILATTNRPQYIELTSLKAVL